jgi:hypothetical protein
MPVLQDIPELPAPDGTTRIEVVAAGVQQAISYAQVALFKRD